MLDWDVTELSTAFPLFKIEINVYQMFIILTISLDVSNNRRRFSIEKNKENKREREI